MNLPRALRHLAAAGITADVLRRSSIDPTDPAAVRGEVETLIAAAANQQGLISMSGLARLQLALNNLLTDADRGFNDALSTALRRDLVDAGVVRPSPQFEGCLTDGVQG
jgi:hypothetical protein